METKFRSLPKLVVALLLLTIIGCDSAVLEYPLLSPDEAIRFPALDGTFKSIEPGTKRTSWLHIGSAGREFPPGFHTIVWVPELGDFGLTSLQFYGFFEKIDGHYFFHLPCPKPKGESKKRGRIEQFPDGWDADSIHHYSLFRFTRSNEGVVVESLNASYVISQIESKSLTGTVRVDKSESEDDIPSKSAMITAKPAELRAYLKSDSSTKLFENEMKFKRMN